MISDINAYFLNTFAFAKNARVRWVYQSLLGLQEFTTKIQEVAGCTRICQGNARVCWVYTSLPRKYKRLLKLQEVAKKISEFAGFTRVCWDTEQASDVQTKHPTYTQASELQNKHLEMQDVGENTTMVGVPAKAVKSGNEGNFRPYGVDQEVKDE